MADALLVRGHEVSCRDDVSGVFAGNVPAAAGFVRGSITDHALDSVIRGLLNDYAALR